MKKKLNLTALIIVFFIIIQSTSTSLIATTSSCLIQDNQLESAIRESLQFPNGELTMDKLLEVEYLFAGYRQIKSLEGLQYCTNLITLYINNNPISDISPITSLINLEELNLSNINIKDQKALNSLSSLTRLKLLDFKQPIATLNYFDLTGIQKLAGLKVYVNKTVRIIGTTVNTNIPPKSLIKYQPTGKIDYLILLDNPNLIESIDAFYKFKTSQGFKVWVEAVSNISKTVVDNQAEKIQSYLQLIEKKHNLKYVLLIGNPYNPDKVNKFHTGGMLPMKYLLIFNPQFTMYDGSSLEYNAASNSYNSISNYPSDQFYSFSNIWTTTNGLTCAKSNSTLDIKKSSLFSLGRIPFSDIAHVKYILDNTIKAESSRLTGKSLIACSFFDLPMNLKDKNTLSGDTSNILEKVKNTILKGGYKIETMYEQDSVKNANYKSTYPLSSENFNTHFDEYDAVYTSAHGGIERYFWKEDINKNSLLDDNELVRTNFINKEELSGSVPFLFMDGCTTANAESIEDATQQFYEGNNINSLMLNGYISAGIGTTRDTIIMTTDSNDSIYSGFKILPKGKSMGDYFTEILTNRFISLTGNSHHIRDEAFYYNYYGDPSMVLYK